MPGPLLGLRVIDLSRVLAGPWATQSLADLGAEVIKIERPGIGDDTRTFAPFLPSTNGQPGESIYFLSTNRGKKSVTIDLAQPEGQELVRRLADTADVLVENYKVGNLAKFKLDYASLSARNPRLIHCSITGFGQTGPDAKRAGYDLVIQAMGGMMAITGASDHPPMKSGVAIADLLTGLYATQAILAALYERQKSGLGQHIDLALLDVQVATLANLGAEYLMTGENPKRHGNAHGSIVPYQDFATKDGRIVLAVANDAQFARLAQIVGLPELAADPRYKANADRVRNREDLVRLIGERLALQTSATWLARLDADGIPAGPINSLEAVFNEPQIEARNALVEFEGDDGRAIRLVGSPMKLSRTQTSHTIPPPKLGADTENVLRSILFLSAEEITQYRKKKII
jgi:crotonobetainyl-CoA:carnitine CoA-transferase CaiB-like acyl-CoA transferase